jgi:restriction system protein
LDGIRVRSEIQKFPEVLQGQRAKKSIFIITGNFSKQAKGYTHIIDSKKVFIDRKQ